MIREELSSLLSETGADIGTSRYGAPDTADEEERREDQGGYYGDHIGANYDPDMSPPIDAEATAPVKVTVSGQGDTGSRKPSKREFLRRLIARELQEAWTEVQDPYNESHDPFERISELALKPYGTCRYED